MARAASAPASLPLPEIKGFIETSFLDWPGLISAVVFLPGCNFRCPYCHNFTLVSTPERYETLPIEWVLGRLKPFVGWVDGVVVSGGEPTLHPGLKFLLEMFKSLGLKVKLDTNGSRPQVLEELIGERLVDAIAMDLKAPLTVLAYRRVTGVEVDIERIKASVELIKASGVDHELRSTIVKPWHGPEELRAMAEVARGARRWRLQRMNLSTAWNSRAIEGLEAYEPEEIETLQATVADPVCARACW